MYMGWGQASVSAAGHPFARVFGHGAVRGQHAGSIKTAAPPYFRGPDNYPAARVLRPRCSRRRPLVGQSPDVPVAQPEVDEGEQLAGRGNVLAAAALDAFAVDRDLRAGRLALDVL
jgi:hypothetical protein